MQIQPEAAVAMSTTNANRPNADMNVTPLIDVLLVLLIISMVITPIAPKGLHALLPQPPQTNSPPPKNDPAVVVQLLNETGETQIKINGDAVTWDSMEPRLRVIFAVRAERVVFLKADAGLDFEQVAQVVNVAHSAGIDHVALLTAKIEAAR